MSLIGRVLLVAGLLVVSVGPVSAGSAQVDEIDSVQTVLAVRFDADFPVGSLMRADCDGVRFVLRPDGSGVETLQCRLSDEPVMIPAFQGTPPTSGFTFQAGPCVWTSDYWFARDGSIVLASTVRYVVTPSGVVNITAQYAAQQVACDGA